VSVVVVDECDDRVGEAVDRVELAVFEHSAFEDGEEQLDLVEPARMGGSSRLSGE
jgi:hypothetical protein